MNITINKKSNIITNETINNDKNLKKLIIAIDKTPNIIVYKTINFYKVF